jgi:enolase
MVEKRNDMKEIIENAINASIKFDELMDSIDFNSYLPDNQELTEVKSNNGGYQTYIHKTKEALDNCIKIIDEVSNNKKDGQECKLISQLFETKKIRLDGRKEVKRENEKKKYIDCSFRLHRAFDRIQVKKFHFKQKDKSLFDNFNWAKANHQCL